MSRRNNNVRGPTSALTEFLREAGITATVVAQRGRPANNPAPAAASDPAGAPAATDAANDEADTNAGPSIGRRARRTTRGATAPNATTTATAAGYASDDLDNTDEENDKPSQSQTQSPSPAKKRKMSKAEMTKLKLKEKQKQKAKKSKKKDGDGDWDGEDEEEEEDEYSALSKSMFSTRSSAPRPPAGSFENCAKCGKQFTVTKYTLAANPPPGYICHACAKASGADPFKKPLAPVPRKRKGEKERRKVVSFEEKVFTSLAGHCINVIGKHILDVEALGDIGAVNMNEIARVISKNRSLTDENAKLFYDVKNTKLTFYDATNLQPPSLRTLASLNPNLTSLRLDFCGHLNDSTITHWSTHLPHLTHLELLGPFLIRTSAWKEFFTSHPRLTGFLITQSPRFDVECVRVLVGTCKGLQKLRLSRVGLLYDAFLPDIGMLKELTYLNLSDPEGSLTDGPVVGLLRAVGPGLTELDLSGNGELTDVILKEGIGRYAGALRSLRLSNVPELTDGGIAEFFASSSTSSSSNFVLPPLTHIDLSRNHKLSSAALVSILGHSGSSLVSLSINSWKDTSEGALNLIGSGSVSASGGVSGGDGDGEGDGEADGEGDGEGDGSNGDGNGDGTAEGKGKGRVGYEESMLKEVDVSWCREVDDFVVRGILERCGRIERVLCYGCNKLTEGCPRKPNVSIHGVEAHMQTGRNS